jgi:hypothetical protein
MQRRARRKKRVTKGADTKVHERANMTRTQIMIMTQKQKRVLAMIQKMVQRRIMMRRKNTRRNLVFVQMMILKMIGRMPSV